MFREAKHVHAQVGALNGLKKNKFNLSVLYS